MKRSRIFLGLTTACLAIAGVVAAKASHFDGARYLYITGGGTCVRQPGICSVIEDPSGAYTAATILEGTPFTLYTQVNALEACLHPVKYWIHE